MKKKNILVIVLILTVISILPLSFYINNKNTLKISISGSKVNRNQYINIMKSKEYEVSQYFAEKYAVNSVH